MSVDGGAAFGVEVFDYGLAVNGDPSVYADHEFTVRVWMGQHMYAIQRSYSSFCMFDAQLRRRYPRSKLPVLPLNGKEQFRLLRQGGKVGGAEKAAEDLKAAVGTLGASISVFGATAGGGGAANGPAPSSSLSSSVPSLTAAAAGGAAATAAATATSTATAPTSRLSFGSAPQAADLASGSSNSSSSSSLFDQSPRGSMRDSAAAGRRSIRRVDNSEVIQQKKMPLTLYLQQLLAIPEILQSDTLMTFLDEEYPDGDAPDNDRQLSPLTSIDLLLGADAVASVSKRVLRSHTVPMHLEEGFIIAWKFQTKNHDIGFSVTFNDAEIITYQRVDSHVKPVTGLFEAPSKGLLTLSFDNAYSRMHTKNLTYWVRVVEGPEYEVAKETAIYKAKERAALQQQRALLHKSLEALLGDLINKAGAGAGLAYNSQEAALAARLRMRTTSTWEGELAQLRDEKKSLTLALEESIRALEVERNAFADSVGRLEAVGASREAVEEELSQARAELEQLRQEAIDERELHAWAIQELQASRDCALEAIAQARREMSEAKALKDQTELVEALGRQIVQQRDDGAKLSEQISRLKAEKKLLKTSYLQAKADADRAAHERQVQAAEEDRLREELRVALDKLATAHDRSRQSSVDRELFVSRGAGGFGNGGGDAAATSLGGGLLSAYANDLSEKLSKIGESVFRPQTPGAPPTANAQPQQQQQYPPTLLDSFGF